MTSPRMRTGHIGDSEFGDGTREHLANIDADRAFVALALAEPVPAAELEAAPAASYLAPKLVFVGLDFRDQQQPAQASRQGQRKTDWTPERIAVLREMWAAGRPQDDIAAALGTSRKVLADQIAWMGLSRRRLERHAPLDFEPKRAAAKPWQSRVALPEGRLTFDQLTATACHFPVGEGPFLFCGIEPTDAGPYCSSCAAIAYPRRALDSSVITA